MGSAKLKFSRMEKGLEQSRDGARIFSKMAKVTSVGRDRIGLALLRSTDGQGGGPRGSGQEQIREAKGRRGGV